MLNRLDLASRRRLGIFLCRVTVFGALAALDFAPLHLRAPGEMLIVFQFTCVIAAAVTAAIAAMRRETPFASSLNLWDESLALNSLALLAHGLAAI